jgi:hypothetical protein
MEIQDQKTIILNHLEGQVSQRLIHSKTDGLVQLLNDSDCAAIFSLLETSNLHFEFKMELIKNGFTLFRLNIIHDLVNRMRESTEDIEIQFMRQAAAVFEILSRDFSHQLNNIKMISEKEMDQFLEIAKKESHVFANELGNFQAASNNLDHLRQIISSIDLKKSENLLVFSKKLFQAFKTVPPFVVFEFCDNELPNIPIKMVISLLSQMGPNGYEPIINQYINISGALYNDKLIDVDEFRCRIISAYGGLMLFSDVNRASIEEVLAMVLHGVRDVPRSKVA